MRISVILCPATFSVMFLFKSTFFFDVQDNVNSYTGIKTEGKGVKMAL